MHQNLSANDCFSYHGETENKSQQKMDVLFIVEITIKTGNTAAAAAAQQQQHNIITTETSTSTIATKISKDGVDGGRNCDVITFRTI